MAKGEPKRRFWDLLDFAEADLKAATTIAAREDGLADSVRYLAKADQAIRTARRRALEKERARAAEFQE